MMRKRQLTGFTVAVVVFLGIVFAYWLAPIVGYTLPQKWVVRGVLLVGIAWGIYYKSEFARKN